MRDKPRNIAPRPCSRCGVVFTPRATNGRRCDDCQNRYSPLRRCVVCDTPLRRVRCHQRVVCTACHDRLRAQNLVYCRHCGKIGALRRVTKRPLATNRSMARCYDCTRATKRPYENQRYHELKARGALPRRVHTLVFQDQTVAERTKIATLLDSGLTQRQVAAQLRINVLRVRAVVRRGVAVSLKGRTDGSPWSEWLTQKELVRIVRHATIMRLEIWRTYGFPMRRYGNDLPSGKAFMWVIHEDAFEAWIRDPETWMLWDLDDIIDDWWRSIALEARPPGSPGWLPMGVVARLWGLSRCGATQRVRTGRYTGRAVKRGGVFWLWSEDVVTHAREHDGRVIVAPPSSRHDTKFGTGGSVNLPLRQATRDALRAVPVSR